MPVYFLASNDNPERSADIEKRVKGVIPDLTRITDLAALAPKLRGGASDPAYVMFVAPSNEPKYVDNLVRIATNHRQTVFFILISDDIAAADYKRLVQTGGADWVSTAGAPQEILDIIGKRNAAPRPVKPAEEQDPVVITFLPSAGGVGNSKLAVEVGVRLKADKATKDRRICLIDLDFQTSHVCSYLDLEPKFRIDEIAADPERLDAQLFDIFKSAHASGLDVIAAPRSKFNYNDLMIEALDALFETASKRYDIILIDLPLAWFSWTPDIVARADAILVTGLNTIPGLHQVVEALTAIRAARSDTAPVAVVINRCEHGAFGRVVRRKHVNQVLGRETVFFVRDDPAVMADSVNTGTPVVTANSRGKVARDLIALAAHCAQVKSSHPAARRPGAAQASPPSSPGLTR
jgi:pilus assembly protein CpaE